MVRINRDTSYPLREVSTRVSTAVQDAYDKARAEADELACVETHGVPLSEKDDALNLARNVSRAQDAAALPNALPSTRLFATFLGRREKEGLRLSTVNRIRGGLPSRDGTIEFNNSLLHACTREKLACSPDNIGAMSELQVCIAILSVIVCADTCDFTIRRNVPYRVTNANREKGTAGEIDVVLLGRDGDGIWRIRRLFEVKGAYDWCKKTDAELREKVGRIRSQVARQMAYGPVSVVMAGTGATRMHDTVREMIPDVNVLTDEEVGTVVSRLLG